MRYCRDGPERCENSAGLCEVGLCQLLTASSTRLRFWCLWYMTIAVPCIWVNPSYQSAATQYVNVFVLPAAQTTSFHGQELSVETEPSLLLVRQYGTVCLSLSDQLRLLLVLSASWKPIWSTFRFNWLLSFINIEMPSRSVLVVGWALN